jgi:hypothetical protein
MKTQQDNDVRMVALENLKAMCERASGTCHRYWIEKVTRSRVWVGYSNPNEYGTEQPFYAVFPSYPSSWREDEDNPRVVLDCLRIVGGGDHGSIDDFYIITDGPHLWRNPLDNTWKTVDEIKREKEGRDREKGVD